MPTKFGETPSICTRVASDCNCPGSKTKNMALGRHGNGRERERKFSDSELQVLTNEVQGHRSKLAATGNNISVHSRGNRVRDAISQSARAAGVFFFFIIVFYFFLQTLGLGLREMAARRMTENVPATHPSGPGALPVSPSALPACFVAEGHIDILLAGQLPSDATGVQIVHGDGADTGGEWRAIF